MIRLMSSAMMPVPGSYVMRSIARDAFVHRLNHEPFVSYIGYPQNAEVLRAAGVVVPIPITRDQTPVDDGDVLLVMRLRYRVAAAVPKGARVDAQDFEYFEVVYHAAGNAADLTV